MQVNENRGYTLIELSLVLVVIGLFLSISGIGLISAVLQNIGLDSGVQLRMVWRAQKLFLIDELYSPQTLAMPSTISQLAPYLDIARLTLGQNLQVSSLPPLDLRDPSSGTAVKSADQPQSGDSMYDVGPE